MILIDTCVKIRVLGSLIFEMQNAESSIRFSTDHCHYVVNQPASRLLCLVKDD